MRLWALLRVMFLAAASTFFGARYAFVREVVPSLTLQAAYRFFFEFVDVGFSVTKDESVRDRSVGFVDIG